MYKEFISNLKKIQEYPAAGFYQALAEGEPWPVPFGRALRSLYENMEIRVEPDRLMLPAESLPGARNSDTDNCWFATAFIGNFNHFAGFSCAGELIEVKKQQYPGLAGFIDEYVADLRSKTPCFGGYTHSNPDIRRVVGEGFLAMKREWEEVSARTSDPEECAFLRAIGEYVAGVETFHARVLAAAQHAAATAADPSEREQRARIAVALERAFLYPAETFLEGLLAVNFTWMLDFCDSIGRFDQALGPLYERDLAAGTLDLPFVRSLLDELWRNFERLNGWNLQLGGRTPEGADGVNAFTYECLAACGRNHVRRPNVAFRITDDTPPAALDAALAALAGGSGRPALYHDDLYIKSLLDMNLGLSVEDAREIGFGGCTETMIAGMSNVGSLEGSINLAKALELALFNGFDPVSKRQEGPATGEFADFRSFDELMAAVKRQVLYLTDGFVAQNRIELEKRFHQGDPKLYRSFFTRDCIRNRRSFEAGGARYNWSTVSYQGIGHTIDSLAAVDSLIYREKSLTPKELLTALSADFEGHEALRKRLLALPKFGNDIAEVDEIGRNLLTFAWSELARHATPRGGRYVASCILFATYLAAGRAVGATPDGRKAFAALSDSVGAVAGRDLAGPTALLNSVLRLPLALAVGTPVLNLRFRASFLNIPGERKRVAELVQAFFAGGGMQAQITALDTAAMRAAQRDPEAYADLLVRIGGYSEYFTRLEPELQDTVIARSEY